MKKTTAENSFMIMISLFENYDLKSYSLPDMAGFKKECYILASLQKKFMPNLYEKFKTLNYTPAMYAQQWFLTLFSDYFPYDVVFRIWDIYFAEGRKTIFRFAIALMKLNEEELIKADECMIYRIL